MLLYLTLALCALLASLLVYRYDMYDREPWSMIAVTILIGAAVMWVTGRIEDETIGLLRRAPAFAEAVPPRVSLALVAATHEELARLLIVAGIALCARKTFNDPLDGIIYGSVAGLGMAIQESVQYLSDWKAIGSLPPTEFLRLLGHLVMGGITGFGIGMVRMGFPRAVRWLLGCLVVAISLHFAWDWIALTARDAPVMLWWQKLLATLLMLWGCLFYGVLVITGSDRSREIFAPRRASSLWGWPFSLWAANGRGRSRTEDARDEESRPTLQP